MSRAPFQGNSTPQQIHQVSRLAKHPKSPAQVKAAASPVIPRSAPAAGVGVTAPLTSDGSTISIPKADSGTDGHLSQGDWNTFSGKEPALGAPAANGQVLASTTAKVRSWVTLPSFADSETPAGLVNGANAAYTLAHAPVSGSVHVYQGASTSTLQRQAPALYSVSGTTLTFTTAPAAGSALLVDYRY